MYSSLMATDKPYFIYLGQERGKRVVHKVGQTIRPCWKRCENADYRIGVGIQIMVPGTTDRTRKNQLNEAEDFIVSYFASRWKIEHGKEYFRTPNYNWEKIRIEFLAAMMVFLEEKGWEYVVHEGWATRDTY